jgi:hypothetical protein
MAKPSALVYCVSRVPGWISLEDTSGIKSWSRTIALRVQRLFTHQSLDNISWISRVFIITLYTVCALRAVDLPWLTNLMRGGQAQHCAFLPVSAIFDIPRKIFKRLSKNLQKPGKLLCVTDFMLRYGFLEIHFVTQAFVLWCRSLRSLFHAYALLQSQYYGIWVTQPKIARIISIVSGVLWWQYSTYASSCIMTKASRGYHMRCTHFLCHILEGVWLLTLPKADWGKVCPGRSRVCPWTVFSFIHLGCYPMTCQQWDEV